MAFTIPYILCTIANLALGVFSVEPSDFQIRSSEYFVKMIKFINDIRNMSSNASRFGYFLFLLERFLAVIYRNKYEDYKNIKLFIFLSMVGVCCGVSFRLIKYIPIVQEYQFIAIVFSLDFTIFTIYLLLKRYVNRQYSLNNRITKSISEKFVLLQAKQLIERAYLMTICIFLLQGISNVIILIIVIVVPNSKLDHSLIYIVWYTLSDISYIHGLISFIYNKAGIKMIGDIVCGYNKTIMSQVQPSASQRNGKMSVIEGDLYFKMINARWA
uniref:7TM_GPCR_Srx domain-containing protein n=1 Tax=Rhabditophanes sp. KR3021 TaxID=114890 RepID=A0AC35TJW6_9BILA